MIVVMQIWEGDKDKAVFTAKRLKSLYPTILLGVLANKCEYPEEMKKYADLIHTTIEDVFAAGTGGLAAHELLCLGLQMPGQIIVKIDPDTKIHLIKEMTDNSFSMHRGVFGKMQQTVGNYGVHLKSINGGALGICRNAARLLVDDKILLDECLITLNPACVSAYVRQKIEARMHGKLLSSHDWTIAWACEQLKIPMENNDLLVSAFEHEKRAMMSLSPSAGVREVVMKNTQLRDEHLFVNRKKTKDINSFMSFIWGDGGVVISKKDVETNHIIKKQFDIIEDAMSYILFKDGQHMTIMARPSSSFVQMLVIDLDCAYDNSVDVSAVKTSEDKYHILMRMEPAISEEEAREILAMANFADVAGSVEATIFYGSRVPSTPSYYQDCMALHDGCVLVNKPCGEVEFVKKVDKYYTKDEAIDVISQLSKVCKARPLVMKEELVLL